MSNQKTVLIIQHYTGIGGSSLACLDVAKAVQENGYRAVIVLPGYNSPISLIGKNAGYEIHEGCPNAINFTYHSASSSVLRAGIKYLSQRKNKEEWEKIILKLNPCCVILNSSAQSPMIEIIKKNNIPCILYIRETIRGNSENLINRYIRKKMSQTDATLFLTEYDKKRWDVKCINTYVVPDVVSCQLDHHKKNKNRISILYLGGFNYEKGILDLLKAFSLIDCKNVELYILGDDGRKFLEGNPIKKIIYYKHYKAAKDSYKIIKLLNSSEKRIYILGIRNDVYKWYSCSDIVVFPVKMVHQARPIFEAGMFSLPVIIPDYPNFIDSVTDGENGLLYRRDNIRDLSDKIKLLIADKKLRKKMGENNHRKTIENHTEKVMKESIKRIIASVLRS